MTDVLGLARDRRAVLAVEMKQLDDFIRMGEALERLEGEIEITSTAGNAQPGGAVHSESVPHAAITANNASIETARETAAAIASDQLLFSDLSGEPDAFDDVLVLSDPVPHSPATVDIHVGQQLRHRRWMLGMSRQELGEKVGVGAAQIQNFEAGSIHISTSRMWDIATILGVPMSYFFENIEGQADDYGEARSQVLTGPEAQSVIDNSTEEDTRIAPIRTAKAS